MSFFDDDPMPIPAIVNRPLLFGDGWDYKHFNDDAEALVFTTAYNTGFTKYLYVMTRKQAQEFCSRDETKGQRHYGGKPEDGQWMTCFTCYETDWRNRLDSFRVDDGRFEWLLDELGIIPIHRNTGIAPPKPQMPPPAPKYEQEGFL